MGKVTINGVEYEVDAVWIEAAIEGDALKVAANVRTKPKPEVIEFKVGPDLRPEGGCAIPGCDERRLEVRWWESSDGILVAGQWWHQKIGVTTHVTHMEHGRAYGQVVYDRHVVYDTRDEDA